VRLGESNVLQEVDYLSTASGGGFAAAIYISELYAHTQQGKLAATFDFAQTLAEDCTLNPPDPQAGRYEGDRCYEPRSSTTIACPSGSASRQRSSSQR
jgi:hypothetical protein